ncbi:MAG: hypothetical protein ACXAEI_00610 [Candidatus Hodarchaeales archaeon]|jgi:hypothetical protein
MVTATYKASRFSAEFIQRIERKLGAYGRYVAFPSFIFLPLVLFFLLYIDGALTDSEELALLETKIDVPLGLLIGLWLFLLFNLFTYLLDSILSVKGVAIMLNDYKGSGMPLQAVRGFDSIFTNLQLARRNTALLFGLGVAAFVSYLLGEITVELQESDSNFPEFPFHLLVYLLSIFLLFIMLAVSSLREVSRVDYRGGLSPLYDVEEFPLLVDNILSEVFRTYLDPMAYLKFDEWSDFIRGVVHRGLGEDYSDTEFERIRELILYVRYLHQNFPAISEGACEAIINYRCRSEDAYSRIKKFRFLTMEQIDAILQDMQLKIPQFFKIIDHVMIQLEDNLPEFRETKLFFDVALPAVVNPGEPIPLFLFFLNNDPAYETSRRPIIVKIIAPGFEPNQIELTLTLDPREEIHLGTLATLPLVDLEDADITKAQSEILQVADALWLTLVANDVGTHAINVFIKDGETGEILGGKNFRVDVTYDFSTLMKRLLGVGAIVLGVLLSGVEIFLSTI